MMKASSKHFFQSVQEQQHKGEKKKREKRKTIAKLFKLHANVNSMSENLLRKNFLTSNEHISKLCKKVSQKLYISSYSTYLTQNVRLKTNLYFSS